MIRINAKELVLKQIARSKQFSQLSTQEKIAQELESMEFNVKMYHKYKVRKNYTRFDKKHLNFNLWTIIERIESIKTKDALEGA